MPEQASGHSPPPGRRSAERRGDLEPQRPNPRAIAIRELALLRIRTFLREPEALFWTFGFPILMAIGLGVAFGGRQEEQSWVGVVRGSAGEMHVPVLQATPELMVRVLDEADASAALRQGEVALVLTGEGPLVSRYDPTRPDSRTARLAVDRALQEAAGATRPVDILDHPERQRGSRYIDWVIPGLIGLNLMSTGLWGIGFGIVNMRQKKQLKRLAATPMRRGDFLVSQILARLAFLVLEVPPIVLFAWLVFDVRVEGSLLAAAAVVLLGTMTFAAIGLLASTRARTVEGVSGIMNVIMLPMFILSGVFFSARRFPDAMQPVIQALPLTALNDALRAVYNDGLPLTAVPLELAILGGWTLASAALALKLFRWN
jgi:ABC-2 type transport system permease protein